MEIPPREGREKEIQMSKRKERFTPGPWYISDYETRQRMAILDRQIEHYDPRHTIATVCRAKGHETANARLIAAAPEMFDFIKSLTSFGSQVLLATLGEDGLKIYDEALRILAKAKGEVQE